MITSKTKILHLFDCDGVILDSNFLKVKAIKSALKEIKLPKETISVCVNSFKLNFGKTLKEHFFDFQDIFTLKKINSSKNIFERLKHHYQINLDDTYSDARLIEETLGFIKKVKNNSDFFVVSGASECQLKKILPSKVNFIKENLIFGGPLKKEQNIKNILDFKGYKKYFYYGDSVHDGQLCLKLGLNFVGLKKYSLDPLGLGKFCKEESFGCCETLRDYL